MESPVTDQQRLAKLENEIAEIHARLDRLAEVLGRGTALLREDIETRYRSRAWAVDQSPPNSTPEKP
jgi:hypothetical protein